MNRRTLGVSLRVCGAALLLVLLMHYVPASGALAALFADRIFNLLMMIGLGLLGLAITRIPVVGGLQAVAPAVAIGLGALILGRDLVAALAGGVVLVFWRGTVLPRALPGAVG